MARRANARARTPSAEHFEPETPPPIMCAAMRIYLACTVRGDRYGVPAARVLCEAVERHGDIVLTRHLLSDDADTDESACTERTVFERDLQWLESADLLIAEASGSSYGVGFEVGYVLGRADRTGQRVLLLYEHARRDQVSRLIPGNSHQACTTYGYRDATDLRSFIDAFLAGAPTVPGGDRR